MGLPGKDGRREGRNGRFTQDGRRDTGAAESGAERGGAGSQPYLRGQCQCGKRQDHGAGGEAAVSALYGKYSVQPDDRTDFHS